MIIVAKGASVRLISHLTQIWFCHIMNLNKIAGGKHGSATMSPNRIESEKALFVSSNLLVNVHYIIMSTLAHL
jgi:hypothetical protein